MSLYLADFNDCFSFLFASPVVTASGYLKLSTSLVITAEVDHQLAISQLLYLLSKLPRHNSTFL